MNKQIYTVSSINQYIKNMFANEYALSVVFVKGEISNCKYHSSGHIYFTIKDAGSQLSCVMFRGDRRGLDFTLEDGKEVIVGGTISVYEQGGKYQLYAKKITLAGDGRLAEQFEKLKKRLQNLGYFDDDRKLPIPKYARRIGIVTAEGGQAIQDIMKVAREKNPYTQMILYPAKVQGEGAAQTIVEGIRYLDEFAKVDVIIVGRGGGSAEDLWAFNEEIVAHAIYDCRTPVISAVGHEGDFSISDFVADMRAPTPTKAAEMAVYDVYRVLDRIYDYKDRMARNILYRIEEMRDRLELYERQFKVQSPENQIREQRQRIADLEDKLSFLIEKQIRDKKHAFALLAGRLDALSPLKKLQSGYAYVSDEKRNMIDSVNKVDAGDFISLTLADGIIDAVVSEVKHGTGKDNG